MVRSAVDRPLWGAPMTARLPPRAVRSRCHGPCHCRAGSSRMPTAGIEVPGLLEPRPGGRQVQGGAGLAQCRCRRQGRQPDGRRLPGLGGRESHQRGQDGFRVLRPGRVPLPDDRGRHDGGGPRRGAGGFRSGGFPVAAGIEPEGADRQDCGCGIGHFVVLRRQRHGDVRGTEPLEHRGVHLEDAVARGAGQVVGIRHVDDGPAFTLRIGVEGNPVGEVRLESAQHAGFHLLGGQQQVDADRSADPANGEEQVNEVRRAR